MSLLADLLSTLIDRRLPALGGARADGRSIEALCRDLIGSKGEVSGYALACQILENPMLNGETIRVRNPTKAK